MQMHGNAAAGSFFIYTLGCAKNEVDSQHMDERLLSAGFVRADSASDADVIIVNTCSFIQAATEESIDAVFDACTIAEDSRAKVIVAGCMPSRYGEDLKLELTEPDVFIGCDSEKDIVGFVADLLGIKTDMDKKQNPDNSACDTLEGSLVRYIKISDGCNRMCSYCTIPYIRGRYRSFPYEDIEAEVARGVEAGAKEIVLIAQDTGIWGTDIGREYDLARLLDTLASKYRNTWFRVMYIQPDGVSDKLIDVMKRNENVASYLDIPIQHVCKEILVSMNRSGDRESFEALIQKIKSEIPDITLRTTLIAGYPGETDEQFEEMLDFASSGLFDYIGVFPYSREEGTRAYNLPNQLDDEEKAYRAQAIRDAADRASSHSISSRAGSIQEVLIEGIEEDGQLFGRTMQQAPEVDGVTFVDKGEIGDIVSVRIEDSLLYDMEGEVVDE